MNFKRKNKTHRAHDKEWDAWHAPRYYTTLRRCDKHRKRSCEISITGK